MKSPSPVIARFARWSSALVFARLAWLLLSPTPLAADTNLFTLFTNATVTGRGIFLADIAMPPEGHPTPVLRLTDAPPAGQALTITPARLNELLQTVAPALVTSNWLGAPVVRVTRRVRQLQEIELRELLVETLKKDTARIKGDVELRFNRPWTAVLVPDEPFSVRITEQPVAGLAASCILRFELVNEKESFGSWQMPVQARLWHDVWVARASILRGRVLEEAELTTERRDLLANRELLTDLPPDPGSWEINENLVAGAPLTRRALRGRPLVYRGQVVEGVVKDGNMAISLRVEALEDGQRGQTVRVRNPQSRRELRGKVQDEQTIILSL